MPRGESVANGPGDLGSIPGRVIPKTFKMVLDTSLLNTQQYKVRIKGKVGQSRERSSAQKGGSGFASIEDSVDASLQHLGDYIEKEEVDSPALKTALMHHYNTSETT